MTVNLSDGEEAFLFYWRALGKGPEPEREVRFREDRRWRFDFAWPEQVAVEIDGGMYNRGRHIRPKGFEGDCEKINAAQEDGWIVLRYTPDMMHKDPTGMIEQIKEVLRRRRHEKHNATT